MRNQRKFHSALTSAVARTALIETLEERKLLSGVVAGMNYPDILYAPHAAAATSSIMGYTPSQIRSAYGFKNLMLSNGKVADGQGQTIAIVDAYNDPNVGSDLSVFDTQFQLPAPPSFKVVNQMGGSGLPANDAGWAGEISLDVEWSHVIAPAANILLVEAGSANTNDLTAAVNYARSQPGVSVVSMSWGGAEYFNWGYGGETGSQTNYDPFFTTPVGHAGVTFVASAGDSGIFQGVQFPAASPNVLSVGGTNLVVNSDGSYGGESSWSGTNGGYSTVEGEPAYQNGVQNLGVRSVPDVTYDADPLSGFAVYDSTPFEGSVGWQDVGGTSAGAPQWSALIALVNQQRALSGLPSLDGPTQVLPTLYTLFGGSPTSTSYTSNFHDVVDTVHTAPWQFPWGQGLGGSQAVVGYDAISGLGSPHADVLALSLATTTIPAGTPGSSTPPGGGGGGGGSIPNAQTFEPIVGSYDTLPAANAVAGDSGNVRLILTNTSSAKFSGPLIIKLLATTDGTVSDSDPVLTTVNINNFRLPGGISKIQRLKFSYPLSLPLGTYKLVATIDAPSSNAAPVQAISPSTVTLSPATVDLATAFNNGSPITVTPGKPGLASILVTNVGNVLADGSVSLSLYESASGALDSAATLVANVLTHAIHLKAGHSLVFRVRFTAPLNQTPGQYSLLASIQSTTTLADTNTSNNTATIATA